MRPVALILSVLALISVVSAKCGKGISGCPSGNCCSYWGVCGTTNDHCGSGTRQCVCDCKGQNPCMGSTSTPSTPSSGSSCTKYYVTAGSLNVRTGPSTSYSKVKTLSKNTVICVYSISNGWAKFVGGYVSASYIAKYNGSSSPTTPTTPTTPGTSSGKIIFIGDSRTVGMNSAVGTPANTLWSAKVSMGYDWMVSTGVPNIENSVKNAKIIILMGVNDYGYYNRDKKYATYINDKAKVWAKSGAKTYYVSVNPVVDSKSKYVKNATIKTFNESMKKLLSGVTYIDTYNHIINSFNAPDGLHYDKATYIKIYNYILSKI